MTMTSECVVLKSRVFHKGGVEKHTLRLAKALHEKGLSVTLLTTGDIPEHPYPFRIVSLCRHSGFGAYLLAKFDFLVRRYLLEHPSPIVFGMDRNSEQTHYRAGNGVHAEYLARRRSVEPWWHTATFSLNPLHRSILSLERRCFCSPALKTIIANSNMVKDEIIAHYDVAPEKIVCVHNGVEWEEMQKPFDDTWERKDFLRREWKIPTDAFLFLFIGNGYSRKGLPFLLEGLRTLDRSYVHLAVVGHDKNPDVFVRMARKLGLASRIHFFGRQSEILPFYQAADSLVIPSLYDPFANVTVEALAMGLHVVSSTYNGGVEVLNADNGTVIGSLFDSALMARALHAALSHPKRCHGAEEVRATVQHLSFSRQTKAVVDQVIP